MHPHAMLLLLLLCSLAVANEATSLWSGHTGPECSVSKIGVRGKSFTASATATIVCKNPNEEIEYDGHRFNKLVCVGGNWTDADTNKPMIPPPIAIHNGFKVVYICTPRGAPVPDGLYPCRLLVRDGTDQNLKQNVDRFTCGEGKVIAYNKQRYDSVECKNMEWRHGSERLVFPAMAGVPPLEVECVVDDATAATATVPSTVAVSSTVDSTEPVTVSATEPYTVPSTVLSTAPATVTTTVSSTESVSTKCDPSLIRGPASEEIHFDEATRNLTCVNKQDNSLTSIESNSLRFNFLTCDVADGWWGRTIDEGAVYEKLIAVDSAKLSIACVEYCRSAGIGTKFEKLIVQNDRLKQSESYIKVSCEDPSQELFSGERNTGGSASCYSGEVGWMLPDGPVPSDTKTGTMMFACREATAQPTVAVSSTVPSSVPVSKPCDPSLIRGAAPREFTYDANNKLTCNDGKSIMYTDAGKKKLEAALKCVAGSVWKREWGAHTTNKATDEITVACVVKDCNEVLVSLGEGVKREANKLSCFNPDEKLQIEEDSSWWSTETAEYDELSCDAKLGWTTSDGTTTSKSSRDDFSVHCATPTTPSPTTTTPKPVPRTSTKRARATTKSTPKAPIPTTMLEQMMQYLMQYKGVFLIVLAIAAILYCCSSWFKEEAQSMTNYGMRDSNVYEI